MSSGDVYREKPLTREEFENLVVEALKGLPKEFKRRMKNVGIVIEDYPSRQLLRQMGLRPPETLLGLYQGVPLDARGTWYGGVLPDKITLFQRPLEEASRSPEELKKNVRDTVIHEIGHHFGLEEEELEKYE